MYFQLEEERLAQIDRENQKLLDRMAQIVNSKGRSYNDYESKRHACMLATLRHI